MTSLKGEHCFIKILLEKLGGPVLYRGQKLGERDARVSHDALAVWLCLIRDMCVEGCKANEGRILKIAEMLKDVDLYELLHALDFVSDWLLQSVADESLRDYALLKRELVLRGEEAKLTPLVLGLAKSHVLSWFHSRSETGFRSARQIFVFMSRLNLAEDVRLAEAAFESWWEAENDLRQSYDFSGDEKEIISEWFPVENAALLYDRMSPHHGGGSTYERVSASGEKALVNGLDDNLREFLTIAGWDPDFSGLMQKPWFQPDPCRNTTGVVPGNRHRIQGVPKNWKTDRFVSTEPTAYQFFQLGVNAAVQDILYERLSGLWYHYQVDTDVDNKELAKLGSIDGKFATIDLSHASDSVSMDLVTEWFGESCLDASVRHLRTCYAEFDLEIPDFWGPNRVRDIVAVKKFAPMGSGLCFLIETITFGSITESAVRHTKGASHKWRVFGDDIVCDVAAVPWLLQELRAKGFSPNLSKSFFNTSATSRDFFRESCGGEYLNGTDVTPKRISRKFNGLELPESGKDRSRSIAQLISLANHLYGFRTARTLVIRALKTANVPVLFDTDGLRGIKSTSADNHHLKKRWNSDYQRWEVKAVVLRSRCKKLQYHEDSYLGEVRLFEYLRLASRQHRKHLLYPEDMVSERMDPYSAWLEVSYEYVELPTAPDPSSP